MAFDLSDQHTPVIQIGKVPENYVVALVSVLGGLSCLTVGLRVFTRLWILHSFGWDDVFIIITLLFFIVYNVGFAMADAIVGGNDTLTLQELKNAAIYVLITEHFYSLAIITLKLSLGMLFLRILTFPLQRWVIYCAMATSTVVGTMYFFVGVFQCGSFSNIWVFLERRMTLQECVPVPAALGVAYTQASVSTLTDWVYALLPLFVLRNANMRRREKFTVFGILSLASIGSIASMIRFKYIPALVESINTFFPHSVGLANWSCVEIGLGIIAGCLATLRPLLRKVFQMTPLSRSNARASATELNLENGEVK